MATRRKRRRKAVARVTRRRRRHRVRASAPRRRRRSTVRRRRRMVVVGTRVNPRRRRRGRVRAAHGRRRRTRRNPGLGSAKGFLQSIVTNVQNGAAVVAGKSLTNMVASKVPFGQASTLAQGGIKLVVASALGMAARKVFKSERIAAMVAAGGAAAAVETALVPMLPASVKGMLGLSSYAPNVLRGVSSYAALSPGRPTPGQLGVTPRVQEVWEGDDGGYSDGIMS